MSDAREPDTTLAAPARSSTALRRWLAGGAWVTGAALLLLAVLLFWLLATASGAQFVLGRAVALAGGSLGTVEGRLVGPLAVDSIEVATPAFRLRAKQVALDWSPWRLLGSEVRIERLHAASLEIATAPSKEPAREPASLAAAVPAARGARRRRPPARGHARRGRGRGRVAGSVAAAAPPTSAAWILGGAEASTPIGRAKLAGTLGARAPFPLDAQGRARGHAQRRRVPRHGDGVRPAREVRRGARRQRGRALRQGERDARAVRRRAPAKRFRRSSRGWISPPSPPRRTRGSPSRRTSRPAPARSSPGRCGSPTPRPARSTGAAAGRVRRGAARSSRRIASRRRGVAAAFAGGGQRGGRGPVVRRQARREARGEGGSTSGRGIRRFARPSSPATSRRWPRARRSRSTWRSPIRASRSAARRASPQGCLTVGKARLARGAAFAEASGTLALAGGARVQGRRADRGSSTPRRSRTCRPAT